MNRAVTALILDVVLVLVFAAAGRLSHAQGLDAAGLWGTAWPFLTGTLLAWVSLRAWNRPFAPWPQGVFIWAITLVGGMVLRILSGQGTATAFVIVAALVLALLLIGWRLVALLVGRAQSS